MQIPIPRFVVRAFDRLDEAMEPVRDRLEKPISIKLWRYELQRWDVVYAVGGIIGAISWAIYIGNWPVGIAQGFLMYALGVMLGAWFL